MRVRVLRAEARAARVPAKVMQLVIIAGKIYLGDELTISGRMRIDIDKAHGVVFPILADVQQRDVSDVFRRGLDRHPRRGEKGWTGYQGHIHILLSARVPAEGFAPANISDSVTQSGGRHKSRHNRTPKP